MIPFLGPRLAIDREWARTTLLDLAIEEAAATAADA